MAKLTPEERSELARQEVIRIPHADANLKPVVAPSRSRPQAAEFKMRVTHRWREFDDRQPPDIVATVLAPGDAGQADNLQGVLRWAAAARATDYQVMVSLRPDCRWPLSPALHQSIGPGKTEWQVPATFLLPPSARCRWHAGAVEPRVPLQDGGGEMARRNCTVAGTPSPLARPSGRIPPFEGINTGIRRRVCTDWRWPAWPATALILAAPPY